MLRCNPILLFCTRIVRVHQVSHGEAWPDQVDTQNFSLHMALHHAMVGAATSSYSLGPLDLRKGFCSAQNGHAERVQRHSWQLEPTPTR